MEEKFKNLINTIKQTHLTSDEKSEMLKKINAFVEYNPGRKHSFIFYRVSPYIVRSPIAMVGKFASVLLLISIVGTGGLSYASAGALPGDFLYPVKTNLLEKLEEQLAVTPEKKVALRQKRIETRFGEVETLIKEKKITKEKLSLVQNKIEKEKEKVGNDLIELKKEDTGKALLAENTIEASIEEHKEAISSLVDIKKEEPVATLMTATEIADVAPTETDFYGDVESDLNITEEDLNVLLNSDSNVGEEIPPATPSEVTDLEVITLPAPEIAPPVLVDPANNPISNIQEETQQ